MSLTRAALFSFYFFKSLTHEVYKIVFEIMVDKNVMSAILL